MQAKGYFMLLINDYSRMTWVTFLKEKFKALDKFKAFKKLVENELGLKIKCLRSNRGGEFFSNEFEEYYERHEINKQNLVARTPKQNGVVERNNKLLQELSRAILNKSQLIHPFWRDAVHTIVYILNHAQIKVNDRKTPHGLWKGRPAIVK